MGLSVGLPRSICAETGTGAALVAAARESLERAPRYDPSYVVLEYPGGDPGWAVGACVDVVIRALRRLRIDLQQALHEDILSGPERYGIDRPDPSIDHRRVRNLTVYFGRHAKTIPLDTARDTTVWLPGDIVIWDLYGGRAPNHIGIISDRRGPSGRPLVIHHFAARAGFSGYPSEDDCLTRWRILRHFRWPAGE